MKHLNAKTLRKFYLQTFTTNFQSLFRSRDFPLTFEKSNVAPIHKKITIKNYRPVSLFPICGKVLERLSYNEMFSFFIENDLMSQIQSGVKPGGSCISQLLSVIHKVYKSFDDSWELRGVFRDISKAFDKVWHKGFLLKIKI